MTGEWRTLTSRDVAEIRIREGWTDEEIVDEFRGSSVLWPGSGLPDSGPRADILNLGTLHGRRRLGELIAELRGIEAKSGATDQWKAIVAAYRACGGRPRLDVVARKMHISESTLRRYIQREGVDDWRDIHARIEVDKSV